MNNPIGQSIAIPITCGHSHASSGDGSCWSGHSVKTLRSTKTETTHPRTYTPASK